jgi:imidazolonepropionase-like amidohydrolase
MSAQVHGAATEAGCLGLINVVVFDGVSEELREGPITIVDGRIVEVGGSAPTSGLVVDGMGGCVIPGLIDAHFHAYGISLNLLELEASPLSYVSLMAAHRLAAALTRGFTTIRDVAGGDPGLAKAIGQRLIASPRYLYTGPALTQTGGHGDPRPADLEICARGGYVGEIVDGVDPLRRAVRERFRLGAHAIKIMTSGGVVSLTDPLRIPQYSAEEVRVVTEEATRRGSYVAAHAYSPEAIVHSLVNGVRSIEHGNLLDQETAELMAQHGAFLVPTLATYDAMDRRGADLGMAPVSLAKNREVFQAGQRAVELALAAGVKVGFGTDLMGSLEEEQLNGLRLQIDVAGTLEALRSATSVNAQLIGRNDLGRVESGAVADLVILDGNPFDDPSLIWSMDRDRVVVQGGIPL